VGYERLVGNSENMWDDYCSIPFVKVSRGEDMKQLKRKEKKPVVLALDEMAALEKGLESERTGQFFTLDEAFEIARQRRQHFPTCSTPTTLPHSSPSENCF